MLLFRVGVYWNEYLSRAKRHRPYLVNAPTLCTVTNLSIFHSGLHIAAGMS